MTLDGFDHADPGPAIGGPWRSVRL